MNGCRRAWWPGRWPRLAWPSTCLVCGRWPSATVCPACLALFARPPAPPPAPPPALDACLAAVAYAYPWDRLIGRFKFRCEPGLAEVLAHLVLDTPGFAALADGCDHIVPVPLSRSRLAERGFNQAWELIRVWGRAQPRLRPKALALGLQRCEGRPDQHHLPRQQRLHNLSGAFAVPAPVRPVLQGRHVLLVDDVTTTGATLGHAARALRQAGAASVRAAVVAATPG